MPLRKHIKYYIGIDIGKNGAICILNSQNNKLDVHVMPSIKTEVDFSSLYELLSQFKGTDVHVSFEKLQGIFGASKKSTWSLAEQSGHINAFCIALGFPYSPVPPKIWQAEMFTGVTKIQKPSSSKKSMVNDTKAMALVSFKRYYPSYPLEAVTGKGGKVNDGMIDAALIATYLKQKIH